MRRPVLHPTPPPYLAVVAIDIRSLYNVGALFRSCDAFGVARLYLCGYTGTPPRAEITKTALGAEQAVPWEHHRQTVRLLHRLRRQRVRIAALELAENSTPLAAYRPRFPLALVVGNEVTGLSRAILRACDDIIAIPMHGSKESLNVAVAAGVALYALRFSSRRTRQRRCTHGTIRANSTMGEG